MLDPTTTQVSPISTPFPAPRDVVAAFLRLTIDNPDLKKAKLHLTRRSIDSGTFDAAAVPAGSTYTLGAEEADELGRRIPVNVKSPVSGTSELQEMTVPVIVVEEDGQWKIDLPATMERLMGGMTAALGQAMDSMGQAMDAAMEGVSQAVAAGVGGATAPGPAKPKAPAVKKSAKAPPKKARLASRASASKAATKKPQKTKPRKVAKNPGRKSAAKPGKKRR